MQTDESDDSTTTYDYSGAWSADGDGSDLLLSESVSHPGSSTTTDTSYDYNFAGAVSGVHIENISDTYYSYDLQGRVISSTAGGTTYRFEYDATGRRVRETRFSDYGTTPDQIEQKVIDDGNPTGYSQVLELRTSGTEAGLSSTTPDTYVLGMDVLGQYGSDSTAIDYLLYDGHGSVRGVADGDGVVAMVSRWQFGYPGQLQLRRIWFCFEIRFVDCADSAAIRGRMVGCRSQRV